MVQHDLWKKKFDPISGKISVWAAAGACKWRRPRNTHDCCLAFIDRGCFWPPGEDMGRKGMGGWDRTRFPMIKDDNRSIAKTNWAPNASSAPFLLALYIFVQFWKHELIGLKVGPTQAHHPMVSETVLLVCRGRTPIKGRTVLHGKSGFNFIQMIFFCLECFVRYKGKHHKIGRVQRLL